LAYVRPLPYVEATPLLLIWLKSGTQPPLPIPYLLGHPFFHLCRLLERRVHYTYTTLRSHTACLMTTGPCSSFSTLQTFGTCSSHVAVGLNLARSTTLSWWVLAYHVRFDLHCISSVLGVFIISLFSDLRYQKTYVSFYI